jgi:hypothetical protein
MCRGGHMYAPTKTWRRWHRKINVNQKRYAVVSALAASALPALVMARGHKIEAVPEVPLVVSDGAGEHKSGQMGGRRAARATSFGPCIAFRLPPLLSAFPLCRRGGAGRHCWPRPSDGDHSMQLGSMRGAGRGSAVSCCIPADVFTAGAGSGGKACSSSDSRRQASVAGCSTVPQVQANTDAALTSASFGSITV